MGVEIILRKNPLPIFGYSGKVIQRNYGETGRRLMDELWKAVRSGNFKSNGINYWMYEGNQMLFTGTAFENAPAVAGNFESRLIAPGRYALYRHIGPYSTLSEAYTNVETELQARGFSCHLPFIEIYGHWSEDEKTQETEILLSLE